MKEPTAKDLYNTFCEAMGGMHKLPWEELPPIVQKAWEAVLRMAQQKG